MRKFLSVLLLVLLCCLSSCGKESPPDSAATEEGRESAETAERLLQYDYDLSQYVTLPDPYGVRARFSQVGVCTEEEIDRAVQQLRLKLATFTHKVGAVNLYDKVTLDYTVLLEGVPVEEEGRESLEIVAGLETENGAYNALGNALVGTLNGGICWVEYTYPDSVYYENLSGKTVVLKGTVLSIAEPALPEFNEDFVRSMEGFENYTVEEFRQRLREDILAEKEEEKRLAVWDAFCQNVTVLGYPEEELEAYIKDYTRYHESMAEKLELDFETFLRDYMEMTREEFEEDGRVYAREMVKNDMIFTQLVRQLGVTLTDEEYRVGAERYFTQEEGNFASVTEFIEYYTEAQIRENLLRDKALMMVVDNAVAIE